MSCVKDNCGKDVPQSGNNFFQGVKGRASRIVREDTMQDFVERAQGNQLRPPPAARVSSRRVSRASRRASSYQVSCRVSYVGLGGTTTRRDEAATDESETKITCTQSLPVGFCGAEQEEDACSEGQSIPSEYPVYEYPGPESCGEMSDSITFRGIKTFSKTDSRNLLRSGEVSEKRLNKTVSRQVEAISRSGSPVVLQNTDLVSINIVPNSWLLESSLTSEVSPSGTKRGRVAEATRAMKKAVTRVFPVLSGKRCAEREKERRLMQQSSFRHGDGTFQLRSY